MSDKDATKILYEEYMNLIEWRNYLWKIFDPEENIGILPVNINRLLNRAIYQSGDENV